MVLLVVCIAPCSVAMSTFCQFPDGMRERSCGLLDLLPLLQRPLVLFGEVALFLFCFDFLSFVIVMGMYMQLRCWMFPLFVTSLSRLLSCT